MVLNTVLCRVHPLTAPLLEKQHNTENAVQGPYTELHGTAEDASLHGTKNKKTKQATSKIIVDFGNILFGLFVVAGLFVTTITRGLSNTV